MSAEALKTRSNERAHILNLCVKVNRILKSSPMPTVREAQQLLHKYSQRGFGRFPSADDASTWIKSALRSGHYLGILLGMQRAVLGIESHGKL